MTAVNIQVGGKTAPAVQLDETEAEGLSKGERTRERLLDLAYESVIAKGFAATSIEELVEVAGITKSGFFYHFRDKNDLALQMLERYFTNDEAARRELARRALELSDDPLHSYLIYLKLYAELMDAVAHELPGCIIATIAFQNRAFAPDVRRLNDEGVRAWRQASLDWLQRIAQRYAPRTDTNLETLADAGVAMAIGGFAIAKATGEASAVAAQMMAYRELVRLAFSPR